MFLEFAIKVAPRSRSYQFYSNKNTDSAQTELRALHRSESRGARPNGTKALRVSRVRREKGAGERRVMARRSHVTQKSRNTHSSSASCGHKAKRALLSARTHATGSYDEPRVRKSAISAQVVLARLRVFRTDYWLLFIDPFLKVIPKVAL